MTQEILTVYENVIQVRFATLIDEIGKTAEDEPLETRWSVHDPIWNPDPFVEAPRSRECCKLARIWMQIALMVCLTHVEGAEPSIPMQAVQNVLDARDWLTIRDSFQVDLTVIDAQS